MSGGSGAPAENRISASRSSTEKEAKALSLELASLLTKRDPWHQDVVFARENLRRQCLSIIFKTASGSDHGSDARSVAAQSRKRLQGLNVLFLSTSHSIIHHFRQRLSAMDKLMAQASGKGDRSGSNGKRGDRAAPSPAQRRRLLHSFRDFLAKEELFWRDLLIRIVGVFDVEEAKTPLRLLQIGVGDWEPDPYLAGNKEIHEQAILLCHKTLICFGDIARYKELFSENKAQNQPKPRGGKLAPKPAGVSKEKTWARAYEAYHQARLLVPDDGNPSNQLAVLSGYQHDDLSTIYHYYRALCVRKAFSTAKQNLGPTFAKILSVWEGDQKRDADKRKLQAGSGRYVNADGDSVRAEQDPTELLERFKRSFVVLHAILFLGTHMQFLPEQFTKVTRLLSQCLAKRILPSDVVVKVTVTAVSAWWYARMYRRNAEKDEGASPAAVRPATLESSALMHALAIASELMSLAVRETQDVQLHEALQDPPTASQAERPLLLAQSISAVLRRALPALRITSMWLLSNTDYLARYDSTSGVFSASDEIAAPPEVCAAVRSFWASYASFANALVRVFPARLLPVSQGDVLLEEDIDMLGFAPLKRRMKEASIGKAAQEVSGALASAAASSSAMHPNEEQVLRVADLLADAGLLANSEACPVVLESGWFIIRKKRLNPTSQPWSPAKAPAAALERVVSPGSDVDEDEEGYDDFAFSDGLPEDEEDGEEATEDDVLDLAMRVATGEGGISARDELEEGGTDDEDEIVYPSRASKPVLATAAPASATPSPPARHANLPQPPGLAGIAGSGVNRTASDLLLQVLQGNSLDLRAPGAPFTGSPPMQSTAAPGLPGAIGNAGASGLTGRSIWSGPAAQPSAFAGSALSGQAWSGDAPGYAAPQSTEALFNSMPNESQQAAGTRSSPNMSPFGSIGQKMQPFNGQAQARQTPFNYQSRPQDRSYG